MLTAHPPLNKLFPLRCLLEAQELYRLNYIMKFAKWMCSIEVAYTLQLQCINSTKKTNKYSTNTSSVSSKFSIGSLKAAHYFIGLRKVMHKAQFRMSFGRLWHGCLWTGSFQPTLKSRADVWLLDQSQADREGADSAHNTSNTESQIQLLLPSARGWKLPEDW